MSPPAVVLFAYQQSPYAAKLELCLLLKGINYSYCTVGRMPPRPALQALGVTYRRIPVLAIGNDIIFDTALAIVALEEAFPESKSLAGRNWALQQASSFFWLDRTVFQTVAGMLPWDALPEEFVKDRSSYRGGDPIDPAKMIAARPQLLSAIRQHMDLIESQLASRAEPTNFFLDTPSITYLDISLYHKLNWLSSMGTADSIFKPTTAPSFPLTFSWMDLIRVAISEAIRSHPTQGIPSQISDQEAASLIYSSAPNGSPKVDSEEPLLVAGWLKLGDEVEVTPTDTGKVPQKGKLVGLDRQRVVIEVVGEEGKAARVHAPRLGFSVQKVK
ncbi:hypothetical protein BCR35DRAFT_355500 [Leucosporidium creatinivorum]|uniref:GST N-terminal domain-containing protein n=1 Tax=Leucosporidium creatinivorum TaxID=106004 RepID=A0A1Y2DFE3_9BASI|nr:hypothetical protein BCR35DRAFT_355500 [Leucosporidium creatinivorum]